VIGASDIPPLLVVLVISLMTTVLLLRNNKTNEHRIILLSLGMHLVFSQALLLFQVTVYREADIWYYRELSTPLVRLMERDFFHFFPQVFAGTFHIENSIGIDDFSSTMSMITTTAFGRLFTGDSLWAFFAVVAYFSFLGKWCMYAVFRDAIPNVDRRYLALATLCVPSVVFWTSGVVKEAYAVFGLGVLLWGAREAIRGSYLTAAAPLFVGTIVVGAFKPYLLFPFAVAGAVWLVFERSHRARGNSFVYLLIGLVGGFGMVVALSAVFPEFSPSHIAEQTAEQQVMGKVVGGGSYFEVGSADRSVLGQIANAPLALVASLARPFLWEVNTLQSGVAALEIIVLVGFAARSFVRTGFGALRASFASPIVLFALTFLMIGGIAIGLATTNFGTLSRYRVPIMPFYAVIVVFMNSVVPVRREAVDQLATSLTRSPRSARPSSS